MERELICSYNECKKYLRNPVTLSCGRNVCESHLDDNYRHSNDEFKCLVCDEQHKISNNGFAVNTVLNKIIMLNLHLNENERKAASMLNKLILSNFKLISI